MPRRPRRRRNVAPPPKGYAQLERRTSLLAWLHARLGYADSAETLADVKGVDEGFDADGASGIFIHLTARSRLLNGVTTDDLRRYDENIAKHLAAMNAGRAEPVVLRRFQHLAALYAEIYLDRYARSPRGLLADLNDFVESHNIGRLGNARWEPFAESDLRKLAFWMATGSGKTLIMHLNYRQFLHYGGETPDNILLITPNEGLSRQHLDDLAASGIPAVRLDLNESGTGRLEPNVVKVTEITKLVEEKRGGGVRAPVEAFEGGNLIFVDEGHKGAGGEAWRKMRDALGEDGFTFEYSATFGQALAAAKDDALLTEYGKAIAFDYSYRHFYNDGYGKDFRILNLRRESSPDDSDTLLLANLLSFYEQTLAFESGGDRLRPYNLERPLWAFVGGSVNAVSGKPPRSDALTIVQFLNRVLSQPDWAAAGIARLLAGESGLTDDAGRDIFADRFDYVRRRAREGTDVYRDILRRVAHAESPGGLRLRPLRGSDGEIGLQAAASDRYFGVINIGDAPAFRRLAEGEGAVIEEDAFAESLFDRINETENGVPPVNVLIGAKKFIEGWNSWRVSSMGLLNIGASEGSQIIQLFGRGVRLRGLETSLKRSAALDGSHPPDIRLLETLDIFAVRANYMAQFRDYLENEGVPVDDRLELSLFIRPNRDFLNKGLVIPRTRDDASFMRDANIVFRPDAKIRPVAVNVSSEATQVASGEGGISEVAADSGASVAISDAALDLVDWRAAYAGLLEYRETKGYDNLAISPDAPRAVIAAGESAYSLTAAASLANPRGAADVERLRDAVEAILRRYADALYRRARRRWESDNMVYKPLDEYDCNLTFNIAEGDGRGRYLVQIPRASADRAARIERLIADCDSLLYDEDEDDPPRIHFDRHLYQPLPLKGNAMTFSPPGLEASEREFVKNLRDFWRNRRAELPADAELFLLRNMGPGKGVGFFEDSGFYPDFILWIKTADAQRIVFIEPHGMIHENAPDNSDKVTLYERLPKLAAKITGRSPDAPKVVLDSFIISATPYQELREKYGGGDWSRERFAERHILFADSGGGYIGEIVAGG